MKKRLQTILAHAGVASRRTSADLIENGKVKVDGKVVLEKGLKLDPEVHQITVGGRTVGKEEKKYYFLFNKPKDVITTVKDTHDRKKVLDFFKRVRVRLYPVGRLDKDTRGLLILTNDGDLAHKLSHPSFKVDKEYEALVSPKVSETDLKHLRKGVVLEGVKTAPCRVDCIKEFKSKAVYSVKLHQGLKRQVRCMFQEVGSRVIELKRVKYAGLTLRRVKEGEYRQLTKSEIIRLKRIGRT